MWNNEGSVSVITSVLLLKKPNVKKSTISLVLVASLIPLSSCTQSNTETAGLNTNSNSAQEDGLPDKSSNNEIETSTIETGTIETGTIEFGNKYPEVLGAKATLIANENWRFSVTLSSKYDTPERYADAWRVLDDQNNELGIRVLGHDHASEQPFTRSGEVQIPQNTKVVFVEGRDQLNGWSGQRFEVALPVSNSQ